MTTPTPPDDGLREAVEALAEKFENEGRGVSRKDAPGRSLSMLTAARRLRAALAAHPAPTPVAGEGDGLGEREAGINEGIRLAARLVRDHVLGATGERVADFLDGRADRGGQP